jgi:hypothetical protein
MVDVGWAGMGYEHKGLVSLTPVVNQHVCRGAEQGKNDPVSYKVHSKKRVCLCLRACQDIPDVLSVAMTRGMYVKPLRSLWKNLLAAVLLPGELAPQSGELDQKGYAAEGPQAFQAIHG